MSKFIISTCLFTFWAFYELSGGADFQPRERVIIAASTSSAKTEVPVIQAALPVAAPQQPTAGVTPVAYRVIPAPDAEPVIAQVALVRENVVTAPEPSFADIRVVAGDWVNMRGGPSTHDIVLDTLPRGTQAEVIAVNPDGWAQIRLADNGQIGWMATRLLSDS
ncbi:SH3 domain-containing protein [Yoonia sediminilitoris]|uniref:SH3 domain-containing protein n=1 Tax=Yoonia sediminilitoris TaxID=1286148 RepID=A0A2T6KGY7_9RHOB|nr:SH3 domain-containing protein [Yoonia sediminilitoris]PUB14786.1 SH3 domain-containing protein [Yoonia sediminilitoris]RCW95503.1 SH3 domain-containing protein [Yoonia sediminilitoris]